MIPSRHSSSACHSSTLAAIRCPVGAAGADDSRAAVSRSAGAITRSPHAVASTSTRPAARAAPVICAAVIAAFRRMPNTRSAVTPADELDRIARPPFGSRYR